MRIAWMQLQRVAITKFLRNKNIKPHCIGLVVFREVLIGYKLIQG